MASITTTGGITIEYEIEGRGEPLLLAIGLSGQLIDWPRELVDPLVEAGFQVIRFDNRDAGLSSATPGPPPTVVDNLAAQLLKRRSVAAYTVDDMADDTAGLLDGLGLDSAHVVGVSMGGMIGQSLAINHPGRVRSLTSIMATTGDPRRGRIAARILPRLVALARRPPDRDEAAEVSTETFALFAGPAWDRDRHRERARAAVARSYRPEGMAHQSAAIAASPDRTADLRRLDVPTLVVHGLADRLVLPSGGVATTRAVPGSRLLLFPDMGHDLPAHRMPELAEAIAANAARARSASASEAALSAR